MTVGGRWLPGKTAAARPLNHTLVCGKGGVMRAEDPHKMTRKVPPRRFDGIDSWALHNFVALAGVFSNGSGAAMCLQARSPARLEAGYRPANGNVAGTGADQSERADLNPSPSFVALSTLCTFQRVHCAVNVLVSVFRRDFVKILSDNRNK